jgi:hypothetical protein
MWIVLFPDNEQHRSREENYSGYRSVLFYFPADILWAIIRLCREVTGRKERVDGTGNCGK